MDYTPQPPAERQTERLAWIAGRVDRDLAGVDLEPWQEKLCQWLALEAKRRAASRVTGKKSEPSIGRGLGMARQVEVATALSGREVSRTELKRLKASAAWQKLWKQWRALEGEQLEEAREIYASAQVEVAKALHVAVQKLSEKVEIGDMEAIRALQPYVGPMLDRVWPKQAEGGATIAQQININLTTAQASGLDAPELVVDAQEVSIEEPE